MRFPRSHLEKDSLRTKHGGTIADDPADRSNLANGGASRVEQHNTRPYDKPVNETTPSQTHSEEITMRKPKRKACDYCNARRTKV